MGAAAEPVDDDGEQDSSRGAGSQRLDKWLWFARVIKTRTQAAGLVTDGKVRINRQRVDKPSHALRPDDVVTVTVRGHVRVLRMLLPGARRGPPPEARTLFEDLTPPVLPASAGRDGPMSGVRTAGQGRPTKRDRRETDRLQNNDRQQRDED